MQQNLIYPLRNLLLFSFLVIPRIIFSQEMITVTKTIFPGCSIVIGGDEPYNAAPYCHAWVNNLTEKEVEETEMIRIVTPSENTNYYQIITEPGNGDIKAIKTYTITIVDLSIFPQDPFICTDDEFTSPQEKSLNALCAINELTLEVPVYEGYTYNWSTGSNTPTTTVGATGTYEVSISDGAGCTIDAEVEVEECVDCLLFGKIRDYRLALLGQEFKRGEKVYICADEPLPITIELKREDGSPLEVTDIMWENATQNSTQPHLSEMESIPTSLICSFKDDSEDLVLEIEIVTDFQTLVQKGTGTLAYDAFECDGCENYPNYETAGDYIIPWKFLAQGEEDKVEFKTNPRSAYYAITLNANNPGLSVMPTTLAERGWQEVGLTSSVQSDAIDITTCSEDPVLKIFSEQEKEVEVFFYLICESDDDDQKKDPCNPGGEDNPNGCEEQESSDFVCATAGIDGFFDQYVDRELWLKGDDKIVENDLGEYVLIAGDNRICETKVKSKNIDCPSSTVSPEDISTLLTNANEIYQSIGITFKQGNNLKKLNINYELYDNDNSIVSDLEQQVIQSHPEIAAVRFSPNSTVGIIVEDLGQRGVNNIGGRGLIGQNGAAIRIDKLNDVNIFSHEIGHGRYGLLHPDNGDDEFIVNDELNLMYGEVEEGDTSPKILRRYQWERIHQTN